MVYPHPSSRAGRQLTGRCGAERSRIRLVTDPSRHRPLRGCLYSHNPKIDQHETFTKVKIDLLGTPWRYRCAPNPFRPVKALISDDLPTFDQTDKGNLRQGRIGNGQELPPSHKIARGGKQQGARPRYPQAQGHQLRSGLLHPWTA